MKKLEFITHLLEHKKMNSFQKERFLRLVANELGAMENVDPKILKDIELIKKTIGLKTVYNENELVLSVFGDIDEFDLKEVDSIVQSDKRLIENVDDIDKTNSDEKQELISKLDSESSQKKDPNIIYVDKKNTPKFLRALNANTYTKFLTHEIDSDDVEELKDVLGGEYVYQNHLNRIKEVFDVLTNSKSIFKENYPHLIHLSISRNLYAKIKNYIYGLGAWGESENKISWSHPELLEWSKKNLNKVPSPGNDLNYRGFIFEETPFNNVVLTFKQEINIRSVNSFEVIFNTIKFNPKYNFRNKIEFDSLDFDNSIELFTDVEKLKQAIRVIFQIIIEKNPYYVKPKVNMKFFAIEDKVLLSIKSMGSYIDSNINSFRYGKSTRNLMRLCNGICDIELIALFKDKKVYKGPIWESGFSLKGGALNHYGRELNINKLFKEDDSEFDNDSENGVEYKLTFDLGL